jgi:Bacterial Ig-like domain (group 2)
MALVSESRLYLFWPEASVRHGSLIAIPCCLPLMLSCREPTNPAVPLSSVAAISIDAERTWLPLNGVLVLSVSLHDSKGSILTDRITRWASSNPEVATVDSAGTVLGLAPGVSRITATSETITDSLVIAVDATGPLADVTMWCPGYPVWSPEAPAAGRLPVDVSNLNSMRRGRLDSIIIPIAMAQGARVIHRYENFEVVRLMIDRDSIANHLYDDVVIRGVLAPELRQYIAGVSYAGPSLDSSIVREIRRFGGSVDLILPRYNILFAYLPDSALPLINRLPGVDSATTGDENICPASSRAGLVSSRNASNLKRW